MPLRTKTLYTKFQVDRTNCFFLIIAPPRGKYAKLFLFDQRLYSYICVPSLVRISNFVYEYNKRICNFFLQKNLFFFLNDPGLLQIFGPHCEIMSKLKKLVWFRLGEKPRTSSQKKVLNKCQNGGTFFQTEMKSEITFFFLIEPRITMI